MSEVYLLIGGNLGNRENFLNTAIKEISSTIGKIVNISSLYESEPWGFESMDRFLNQVLIVKTQLPPFTVLKTLQNIENTMGRTRLTNKYESRTIDIDILFYDNEIINHEFLQIPHPHIQKRKFTLLPLAEIAGNYIHPFLKKSIFQLHQESTDTSKVALYTPEEMRN